MTCTILSRECEMTKESSEIDYTVYDSTKPLEKTKQAKHSLYF